MLVPINNAGQHGIIRDRQPHELPLNAWSDGQNVRFRNGFAEKFLGERAVFGTPTIGAYFLLPVISGSNYFWLQCGLTKVHVWDGISHTDITRTVGGDYATNSLKGWTGCVVGGVAVINNQTDVPQQWLPAAAATKLTALANWDANWRCGALRQFRRHLVALDIIKSGTQYPHMVKWSHPADTGSVPPSWDETDDTRDAGEYEFGGHDPLVDAAQLRDLLVVYKEESVHAMQYVGGTQIFRFHQLFDSFGLLTRKCAVEFSAGRHAVFAKGDLIVHDGQSWDSLVSRRMRSWIFSQLDPDNYETSFVAVNHRAEEVWFCFPTTGNTLPNLAIVWNWRENTLGVRDISSFAHIADGFVNTGVVETWATDSVAWDSDPSGWADPTSSAAGRKMLAAYPGVPKLLLLDELQTFDSTIFTSSLERTGLALPVRQEGPPDMQRMKFLRDIWPRIEGTDGATVQITVGRQDAIDSPVTWEAPRNFVIGSGEHVDVRLSGRLFAFKVSSAADVDWRLHGYEVDVKPLGKY